MIAKTKTKLFLGKTSINEKLALLNSYGYIWYDKKDYFDTHGLYISKTAKHVCVRSKQMTLEYEPTVEEVADLLLLISLGIPLDDLPNTTESGYVEYDL